MSAARYSTTNANTNRYDTATTRSIKRKKIGQATLAIIHASVAVFIISMLYTNYSVRKNEFQSVETSTIHARKSMETRAQKVNVQRALLEGLQDNDPYVIEKIAREKYGYHGYNELSPPKRQ